MEQQLKTLTSVLKRNGYQLTDIGDAEFAINQTDKVTSKLNTYFIIITLIVCFGLSILFMFGSLLLGGIIIGSAAPIFFRLQKLKGENLEKKKIKIGKEGIKVDTPKGEIRIGADKIDELTYHLNADSKGISKGAVKIITAKKQQVDLIVIYGDDKRYVEDDVKTIANVFAGILNQ